MYRSSKRHKHDEVKITFSEKKQTKIKFDLFKKLWNEKLFSNTGFMYIEYKIVKFKAINFSGQASVKYFMQTQLFWFCKGTAKVSSLSHVRNNY